MALTTPSFAAAGPTIRVDIGRSAASSVGPTLAVTIGPSPAVVGASVPVIGREAADLAGLVARLHPSCSRAHVAAALLAVDAARGGGDVAAVLTPVFEGVVAERIGDHLRSIFAGESLAPLPGAVTHDMLADLRSVVASARTLDGAGGGPHRAPDPQDAVETVCRGVARLGLGFDRRGRFRAASGGWAATVLARVEEAAGDVFLPVDPLTAADDPAVLQGLLADPRGFAAHPRLPGRLPETGPHVRIGGADIASGRARLTARLAEVAAAADLLAATAPARREAMAEWATCGRLDRLTGFAAVECPRGRLHHFVRLDANDRVVGHAIIEPAAWNLGPHGPLAATLHANRYEAGPAGVARVERIATLFDPAVAFTVELVERAVPDAEAPGCDEERRAEG